MNKKIKKFNFLREFKVHGRTKLAELIRGILHYLTSVLHRVIIFLTSGSEGRSMKKD